MNDKPPIRTQARVTVQFTIDCDPDTWDAECTLNQMLRDADRKARFEAGQVLSSSKKSFRDLRIVKVDVSLHQEPLQ